MRFIQHIRTGIFLGTMLLSFFQCEKSEAPTPQQITLPAGAGFEKLSEYNFFTGSLSDLSPNIEAGVLPYDLNMALFSDYLSKKRFVYVPEGHSIVFDTTDVLSFPLGSVLIKHFYFETSEGEEQFVETRLLIRRADDWQTETYIWNEEQTDARRSLVGATQQLLLNVNGVEQTLQYLIPNQNQCKNCHGYNNKTKPIGPDIYNLNKDYAYDFGAANQLDTWASRGLLSAVPSTNIPAWPRLDGPQNLLGERARAYLAVNCASCHRPEGSAANSGLYLGYRNNSPESLGLWKTPVAAGSGSGGFTYVIHPGQADQSILLYRMISNEVNARMPEIGRELMHQEGVDLIRDWINSLN